MKKCIAITAALVLTLAGCGHTAPDTAPTATIAPETAETTAGPAAEPNRGSGTLRMLTAAADGVYYQAFNDAELHHTGTLGCTWVYAIDEQTGDARPVCSLPGCAHDSDTCPARSDGNMTLCYGDGDEVYLLMFYYNDETSYYRWERINSDHTERILLAEVEPGLSVVGRGVAVDDANLYYSVLTDDNRYQTLWAVDKTGGQAQKICTWDDLADGTGEYAPEMYTLLEVSGQQMTFAKMIQSNDARTKAMQVCTANLTDGSVTPRQRYERDAGNVLVQGDGMETRSLISYHDDYLILTEGSRGGLADCNYQSGEVSFVDAAADTLTTVADGLPTTQNKRECYYSLTGFADGWLLWVDECGRDDNGYGTGDNTTRQYFCRDGVKTELTQRRYVQGKDVQNIRILDAQQGRVLAAYDSKFDMVQDVDEDGTLYTRPMSLDVYGVIALDDLLAGSTDFTPLNFAE